MRKIVAVTNDNEGVSRSVEISGADVEIERLPKELLYAGKKTQLKYNWKVVKGLYGMMRVSDFTTGYIKAKSPEHGSFTITLGPEHDLDQWSRRTVEKIDVIKVEIA